MFAVAIRSLKPSEETVLSAQLEIWRTGSSGQWARIVANLETETALPEVVLAGLLTTFAAYLTVGDRSPENCWVKACQEHQFRGRTVIPPVPERLGRAVTFPQYAGWLSSLGLTRDQAEKLIRKASLNGPVLSRLDLAKIRRTKLGRYVIWATYNESFPSENPFDHLPQTIEAVRTALGLGECPVSETLVLLSYRTELSGPTVLELFRPTICDAADYSYYRPHPEPASICGRTQPLDPNPAGYPGQPEVVHREISGETLVLPLYLTR